MRICLDDIPLLAKDIAPYPAPLWVQEGHQVPWPPKVPAPHYPWLPGRPGVLHSSAFGYLRNVETGEKVYISSLLSDALSRQVKASWQRRQSAQPKALPFSLWRRLWREHRSLKNLSRHWHSFFPTVLSVWDTHSSTKAAAAHIVKFWTTEEITLTARVLQCRPDAFFIAKTLMAIKNRDDLIPF